LIVFNLYPQGVIQHPLMGIDVIWWFHASFYDVILLIKLVTSLENAYFVPLGDLMPHLRPNVYQNFMGP
jgi:hypothetical protein